MIRYLTKQKIKPALGELLLAIGVINEKQLSHALEKQKSNPAEKIGNVLVELGYLSKQMLVQFLMYQSKAAAMNLTEGDNHTEIVQKDDHEKLHLQTASLQTAKQPPVSSNFQYIGELKNGKRHGKGILVTDENRYVGDFVNGVMHGEGTMTTLDGYVIHSGKWVNGKALNAKVKAG